jgi:hypothetical protein
VSVLLIPCIARNTPAPLTHRNYHPDEPDCVCLPTNADAQNRSTSPLGTIVAANDTIILHLYQIIFIADCYGAGARWLITGAIGHVTSFVDASTADKQDAAGALGKNRVTHWKFGHASGSSRNRSPSSVIRAINERRKLERK